VVGRLVPLRRKRARRPEQHEHVAAVDLLEDAIFEALAGLERQQILEKVDARRLERLMQL
jgi:hypothetical protein